ncbi:TetR/AcrR family transcriptional regulator [Kribbella sindirgiensis]|uniref:TetR/AcrR family transcriptional regulator n=1 Tax=Kribbella sindirgiensis TaxID=1124744 RepID=A0A4R0IBT0_9ACTN|nr:TetR/AcrR family transcriptional regulator [Kribbella sindirgiensis]TCC26261.1 TetR/AcrR family transcriptional regulator [Kribbella sindirgiensis]
MPSARGRNLTFTEEARRAQLIDVTIELVADHGYAASSLGRIAEKAGITKAGVLYHYRSKQALVEAAHEHVLSGLVATVGAAVEAAGPADGPAAYIRSMVGHLRERPRHVRMLIEAITSDASLTDSTARWSVVAALVSAARAARGLTGELDVRSAALLIGGGIDAIVSESLADPAYDAAAAAELLVDVVERGLLS